MWQTHAKEELAATTQALFVPGRIFP